MPRYYFNIRDGRDVFDTVGTDLVGPREVRFHMIATATALIEEESGELGDSGDWEMEALSEDGRIVCTMTFNVSKGSR